MQELGVYGDVKKTNLLIKEFINGREENLTKSQEEEVNRVKDYLELDYGDYSFSAWSRQKCKDLFISMSFRGKSLTWKDLPQNWMDENKIGPYLYPTDFGACCFLAPHLNLEPTNFNISGQIFSNGDKYHSPNSCTKR